VGTDDSTIDTLKWTPENASTSSDMVLVETHEYDHGGVGNGNRTSTTQYPGGGADPRTTEYAFDWRNRLVITKAGATDDPGTEATSVTRPLTYVEYDNLGRAIAGWGPRPAPSAVAGLIFAGSTSAERRSSAAGRRPSAAAPSWAARSL